MPEEEKPETDAAVREPTLTDALVPLGVLVVPVGGALLLFAVFASALGLNTVAGDQYIALVLPSRVFRVEFAKRGLAPTNLSRLAADSAPVTSPLVPWNSCGAFMGAVLGVATFSYLPYAIFNYASPAPERAVRLHRLHRLQDRKGGARCRDGPARLLHVSAAPIRHTAAARRALKYVRTR
ncbi:Na+/H+ antiporter NhaC family protein [Streptomyces sp. ID05-39B]|uniref:Na+/H+ antiporter NhaC family protein n=1 Tax=Streptomyces sp. ID05-39B TaxID=3028664 RepID=UPI0029B47672|nr:Na+/H+ antiporter NhaC family protein [Streptomyces sp. ID05-39B]MDX3525749.1 Na+/H+ antiporter NhaC family protein [Streptomyces sp. ID05-39B]